MRDYELNLIPPDIIQHEIFKERIRYWIFVFIGCFLLVLITNIAIKVVNNSISREINILESNVKRLSAEVTEFSLIEIKEKEMVNIKERLIRLSQKGPMMDMFAAIDNSINNGIILTHLEARYDNQNVLVNKEESSQGGYFNSNPPSNLTNVQKTGDNIVILQGTSQSNSALASLLSQLSDQTMFNDIALKYIKTGEAENGKTIMFGIECRLRGKNG